MPHRCKRRRAKDCCAPPSRCPAHLPEEPRSTSWEREVKKSESKISCPAPNNPAFTSTTIRRRFVKNYLSIICNEKGSVAVILRKRLRRLRRYLLSQAKVLSLIPSQSSWSEQAKELSWFPLIQRIFRRLRLFLGQTPFWPPLCTTGSDNRWCRTPIP